MDKNEQVTSNVESAYISICQKALNNPSTNKSLFLGSSLDHKKISMYWESGQGSKANQNSAKLQQKLKENGFLFGVGDIYSIIFSHFISSNRTKDYLKNGRKKD